MRKLEAMWDDHMREMGKKNIQHIFHSMICSFKPRFFKFMWHRKFLCCNIKWGILECQFWYIVWISLDIFTSKLVEIIIDSMFISAYMLKKRFKPRLVGMRDNCMICIGLY
jgi:hypothetical protein